MADTPDRKSYSQHANIMAVLSGAVSGEEARALVNRIQKEQDLIQATYYYRFYLNRALRKVGLADTYVASLNPWRQMLALNLTTFAERPEPTRSDCHAWSASPNYEFLATVCGIEPAEAGFGRIALRPALGNLKSIECKMPHPRGLVALDIKAVSSATYEVKVSIPEGVPYDFYWGGKTYALKNNGATTIPAR